MPFKSKRQMRACFASDGFGGKVDCKKWAKKTKRFKDLPEKVESFSVWLEKIEKDQNIIFQ